MSREDYAHWNEDADRVWWEEEGRHDPDPGWCDRCFRVGCDGWCD